MQELTQNEITRYSRHFPIIGSEGQRVLKNAKVVCVGAGGLACGLLPVLAASGVGHITIIDGDTIELSNLQRQTLYQHQQIGLSKASCAAAYLKALNNTIEVHPVNTVLTEVNATIFPDCDIIVDASDNFSTRYLLNRLSLEKGLPLVSASIFKYEAQLTIFNYQQGPCYECLYPKHSDECDNCTDAGVLGAVPHIVGGLQANEVIKLLLGVDTILSGTLLSIDLLNLSFKQYQLHKSESCMIEHGKPTSQATVQEISVLQLQQLLTQDSDAIVLIDVREKHERQICDIGGQHIPLAELPSSFASLSQHKPLVLYCKSGGRSMQAARFLIESGFKEVYNLTGGILQWITTVDRSLTKY